jgi:L-ascorbate metabolism protein UlaG (beta-lactamase superfamily)
MKRKKFITNISMAFTASLLRLNIRETDDSIIKIQHIRNATLTINYKGKTLLVDPLFSIKHDMDPIPWTNDERNPSVDLPFDEDGLGEIINKTDAVLLTHLHPDHWDATAQTKIPGTKTIICQPEDEPVLMKQGFNNLLFGADISVSDTFRIIRVAARHGHGEIAEKMAPVCGYVIKAGKHTIYITGDTIWYEKVEKTIKKYKPDIIIANAGAARFQFGEPITMTAEDVANVIKAARADATVVAIHMEAINHCYLTREQLRQYLVESGFGDRCIIPPDGEILEFK